MTYKIQSMHNVLCWNMNIYCIICTCTNVTVPPHAGFDEFGVKWI